MLTRQVPNINAPAAPSKQMTPGTRPQKKKSKKQRKSLRR